MAIEDLAAVDCLLWEVVIAVMLKEYFREFLKKSFGDATN